MSRLNKFIFNDKFCDLKSQHMEKVSDFLLCSLQNYIFKKFRDNVYFYFYLNFYKKPHKKYIN